MTGIPHEVGQLVDPEEASIIKEVAKEMGLTVEEKGPGEDYVRYVWDGEIRPFRGIVPKGSFYVTIRGKGNGDYSDFWREVEERQRQQKHK